MLPLENMARDPPFLLMIRDIIIILTSVLEK
jgi:hypothetical protein